MKFYLFFAKKSVAEWQQCYYDYEQMKEIITLSKKAYAIKCNIEDLAREDSYSLEENQVLFENKEAIQEIRAEKVKQIGEIAEEANFHFYKYHSLNKRVVFIFLQYKIHSLSARLSLYDYWEEFVVETKPQLNKLISNVYAECLKLSVMTKLHIEAYEKIYRKHLKAFKNFQLTTPGLKTARLVRSLSDFKNLNTKLDQIIESHSEIIEKQNKFKLIQERQPSPFRVSAMSYFFGLFNGFSVCVFITCIVLLAVNLSPTEQNLEARLIFRNQFRLWKCTGLISLYMWVFAISIYIFERTRINYPLIFEYQHVAKKSMRSLGTATVVLLAWCSFFVFYVMDMLGIYTVARVSQNPSYPITIFFPLIMLGIFIVSMIVEFLYTRRGALLMLLVLFKILVTLFGTYQLAFNVIWATEQLTSLFEMFADFAYSICYYSRVLNTPAIVDNPCFDLRIIPECIAIFVYSLRLIQCVRLGYENGRFWATREMYRFLRATSYIVLAALSIAVNSNQDVIPWVWLGLVIIGSIYGIFIDMVLDWNLFFPDSTGKFVRKQYHIFSLNLINFMIAFNVIARFSFPITFSANLIYQFVPSLEILVSIAGVLELGRRLVWNLLRVENEQIKNNHFFQIRIDYDRKEKKVLEEITKKKEYVEKINKLDQQRGQKELELLREFIREKFDMRQKIKKFCRKGDKKLDLIEDQAQVQIFGLMRMKGGNI